MNHIVAKLEELTELKAAAEITRLDYEAKRDEILKAVQAELEALEAEYAPLLEAAAARISALELEVKDEVLQHGASVKGGGWYAMYSRGRVTWDNKALDSYARAHPEIIRFRKEGAPSVSLRVVKAGPAER